MPQYVRSWTGAPVAPSSVTVVVGRDDRDKVVKRGDDNTGIMDTSITRVGAEGDEVIIGVID